MSFFNCPKRSKRHQLLVELDARLPSSAILFDTENAGVRVGFRPFSVLAILSWRRYSEIAYAVVHRVAIDVVYVLLGPVSVVHCPYNTVHVHIAPHHFNSQPTAGVVPSDLACFGPVVSVDPAGQRAGFWAVVKDTPEFFYRNFGQLASFINGLIAGGCGRMAMKHLFAR